MTLKLRVATSPNGDGDLHKSVDGGSDYSLLEAGDFSGANIATIAGELGYFGLSASELAQLGAVRYRSVGTFANNANAKTLAGFIRPQGSPNVELFTYSLPANKAGKYDLEMITVRTGVNTQRTMAKMEAIDETTPAYASKVTFTDTTQDESGILEIGATGVGTLTGDVTEKFGSFEKY